jgi:hypothetical protein
LYAHINNKTKIKKKKNWWVIIYSTSNRALYFSFSFPKMWNLRQVFAHEKCILICKAKELKLRAGWKGWNKQRGKSSPWHGAALVTPIGEWLSVPLGIGCQIS